MAGHAGRSALNRRAAGTERASEAAPAVMTARPRARQQKQERAGAWISVGSRMHVLNKKKRIFQ